MGEWAPLGPAADPVERPLVLVEGARVPWTPGQVDGIPTYTYTHDKEIPLETTQSVSVEPRGLPSSPATST